MGLVSAPEALGREPIPLLPAPDERLVDELRDLLFRECSIRCDRDEARDLAGRLVGLFYVLNYETHPLCPKVQ